MEFAKQEFEAVGHTIAEVHQDDVNELNELQLVIVGGGIGEVTLC
jgi:hypothetical protein